MKKLLAILLSLLMLLSLCACSVEDVIEVLGDEEVQGLIFDLVDDSEPSGYDEPEQLPEQTLPASEELPETAEKLDPDGTYTSKEDVARYLIEYGHLPQNFIKKKDAEALGWEHDMLEKHAPGKCIGGDYFGNYERLLPTGRSYTECDIDTLGAKSRGEKRLVFSVRDGVVEVIYYTEDHYGSFELIYGEE